MFEYTKYNPQKCASLGLELAPYVAYSMCMHDLKIPCIGNQGQVDDSSLFTVTKWLIRVEIGIVQVITLW